MKKILVLLVAIVFCNVNLKGQNIKDGWYADGYYVETVTCYSFQKLEVAFTYNQEWSQYDYLNVVISCKDYMMYDGAKAISLKSINSFIKGNHFVYTIFGTGPINSDLMEAPSNNIIGTNPIHLMKAAMKYNISAFKKEKPAANRIYKVTLYGLKFTGTDEVFDETCQCVKKVRQYSSTELSSTFNLTCANRGFATEKGQESMDLTTACTYPGTKVDFNSLGGKSSSGNSNTKTPADKKATKEDDDKDDDKD